MSQTKETKKLFDNLTRDTTVVGGATISFSMKGFGFGEIVLYEEGGKLRCKNKHIDKESLKKILNIIADCVEMDDQ